MILNIFCIVLWWGLLHIMKYCVGCNVSFNSSVWQCPECNFSPELVHNILNFCPTGNKKQVAFQVSSYEKLYALEASNYWFKNRNALIKWALTQYFSYAETVCEVGCGTGYVLSGILEANPELKVFGSELYAEGLQFAKKRLPTATLFQADATAFPYFEEFDVIGAFDVLEHIQKDQDALQNLFNATKPGGGLLITVPQHPWLWSEIDEYACHCRRYTKEELCKKVKNAGYEILRVTSFVSFLLPILMMTRKFTKVQKDGMKEFSIGKTTNFMLEFILSIEKKIIKLGGNFPVGGSLMLVARKAK